MSGQSEIRKRTMKKMQKAFDEMSPERQKQVELAFKAMQDGSIEQPPMRQMHFDGEYSFDHNRKQVELNGVFSKEDLLRIVAIMD